MSPPISLPPFTTTILIPHDLVTTHKQRLSHFTSIVDLLYMPGKEIPTTTTSSLVAPFLIALSMIQLLHPDMGLNGFQFNYRIMKILDKVL